MTSFGAILLIGFQLSGGDGSMNSLVWYSWLGGILIGTMTGSNMVLEDQYRAGPNNGFISRSKRGLGKALAREFLLSEDRVIVTSRSFESVDMIVKELEQNLKEIMSSASESARKKLSDAKVVGIACDVCNPEDVEKLSNFVVKEIGSINIWTIPGMENNTNMLHSVRGLPHMVIESIIKCDADIRREWYSSILESPQSARVKMLASGNTTKRRFRYEEHGTSYI